MGKLLTERRLQTVQPPATGRLEIADGGCPGLQIRVTPNDVRSWYFIYRLHGHRGKVLLGHYPALTLADARKTARLRAADVAKGTDPAQEKRRATAQGKTARENSVEAVIARYIEAEAKPNNRTWRKMQVDLTTHILPKWGKMPIASIDHTEANRLIKSIATASGPHMARLIRSYVHVIFKWAAGELGIIPDNVIRKVPNPLRKLPKSEKERDRVLSPDEIRKVWAATEAIGSPYGPLVQVLLYTGQRKGEVSHMRWSDVDLDNAVWSLAAEQTKAARAHVVPLAPQVVALLRGLRASESGEFVFTYGAKPVNSFSAAKDELDRLSGVSGWRFHDLRRTASTHMAEQCDISYETIGSVLNHAKKGVTAIYDRSTRLRQRADALAKWADYLDALVRGDVDTGKIVAFAGGKR